jgi:PPOX class probable F420-dependent enzyme
MAASIGDRERELMTGKNFAHVATLRRDGTPHISITWADADGDEVVLNSAEGRDWIANLRRDERVTLTVTNHENPYEYVEVRGRLAGTEHEGADEHIDRLAQRYLGEDTYPFRQEGEQRVIVRVAPERVKLNAG